MSERFTLTEDHIKLLRAANVRWNHAEWGAPTIDPKRPYGNSDLYRDIVGIVERPLQFDWEGLTAESAEGLAVLHKETELALQIVLTTGQFKPGVYEQEHEFDYRSWRLVP